MLQHVESGGARWAVGVAYADSIHDGVPRIDDVLCMAQEDWLTAPTPSDVTTWTCELVCIDGTDTIETVSPIVCCTITETLSRIESHTHQFFCKALTVILFCSYSSPDLCLVW